MPIGRTVRRLIGPLEPVAIRLYRNLFIDLDALAATIASLAPDARRVLEIGCGDGAMATSLQRVLPKAHLLGIDPGIADPGRMFIGDRSTVQFEASLTTDLIARGESPFDLVLVVDVLHHVADSDRAQVLIDAAALTAPGGTVVIKEWEQVPGLGNRSAFVADRYVSGDATVRFMPRTELDDLLGATLGELTPTCEARIPPRRANLLLAYHRPDAATT